MNLDENLNFSLISEKNIKLSLKKCIFHDYMIITLVTYLNNKHRYI